MERRYRTAEAAAIIGISPKTLRNILSKQRRGKPTGHEHLAHEYIGNRNVFLESVLKAWVKAEHRRGLKKYEVSHGSKSKKRYMSLKDWDGRGHRCEYCGLVRIWLYQMKNHLARRKVTGRCPVPKTTGKVDPAPRSKTAKKPGKKRERPGRPKQKKIRAKPKRRTKKRGRPERVKDWKKLPLSVLEGWHDDEYQGT